MQRPDNYRKPKGKLMIIGGAERSGDGTSILETVAGEARRINKPLLIITAATSNGRGPADEYLRIFREFGAGDVDVLDIDVRTDAYEEHARALAEKAGSFFFVGGDQLRITSEVGDSPVYRRMRRAYIEGGFVAGTSAGAAAMPETMIIGGPGDESNRISALSMASGLGLLHDVIIDSHFAERGRLGRLLGAVVQNPRNLGVGIDERTAILVERDERFRVIGSGAVYIVDGAEISYSSLAEDKREGVVTIHDLKLHVLGDGDCYDLQTRKPVVDAKRNGK
jgi:cyanophycinase